MRNSRVATIASVVAVALLVIATAGCTSTKPAAVPQSQIVTVQRGNLQLSITATGNLVLSQKQDLAIEVTGTQQNPVTVREVLVTAGSTVKAGQVLVKLDDTVLQDKVTTQQQSVKMSQQSLATAQTNLTKATQDGQIQIDTAKIDLETATINFNKLNYPFNYSTFAFDVPAAIDDISTALNQMTAAVAGLAAGSTSTQYGNAMDQLRKAQDNLSTAQERLRKSQAINVFDTQSVSKSVSDYLGARTAQISMQKAQNNVEQAMSSVKISVDKAKLALDNAQDDLNNANDDLKTAKDDLGKTVVTAPFDGFVTKVSVVGGDAVQKGTVAVQIADPTKFEADILVSEMDILGVQVGSTATVQLDALSGDSFRATVTQIFPTGTISGGVVNYKVITTLDSLAPIVAGAAGQGRTAETGGLTPSSGATGTTGQTAQPKPTPTRVPRVPVSGSQNVQLREGLTATVTVPVDQRSNVLLVPNRAITRQGGNTFVQVAKAGGGTEQRQVKVGVSDGQRTEITSGLDEGEQVAVGQTGASAATPTPAQGGGIRIPGIGGLGR